MDSLSIDLYKTLLEGTREAVFLFDNTGRILYANPLAYRETDYADFDKVNIVTIFPMALFKGKERVLWSDADGFLQTFAYRSNNTCYSVRLTCRQLDDKLFAAYAVNDSERYEAVYSHKKAMEEVEAADKMKNEFTANITHELRTPINGIKGMAEGLADTEMTSEQAETVSIILRCCDNMTKIINDILDYSKIEAGRIELENREFSLNKFINDTLTFHIGRINEKHLKLLVNVVGQVPDRLIGDELRLGQILNNLFSNAIKFTSAGHICLEVSASPAGPDETELLFMVIDTGIGIAPEERDKLFRSFSQVDGSITRRFGGTGLGLAITRNLVTLMGGSISVDSEKGKGSTFSFSVILKNGKGTKSSINFPQGSFEFKSNLPLAASEASVHILGAEGESALQPDWAADNEAFDSGFLEDTQFVFTDSGESQERRLLSEKLEKLLISIEMGSWEKAEGFAEEIRNLLSENPELKRKAFALLLSVRKELYDQALKQYDELTDALDNVENS